MLLQAYDFLHLYDAFGCRLQLGGSDQWGNITMGIDLIRRLRRGEAWGLTTPLVVKADGTKFGKTEAGTVWLDADRTSPYQLYQFFLRTEDAMVGAYLRYFTFLDHERDRRPRRRHRRTSRAEGGPGALAREVCTLVHGAGRPPGPSTPPPPSSGRTIADLDEARSSTCSPRRRPRRSAGTASSAGVPLADLLVETGMVPSKSRARTTIEQGGAYVNSSRETSADRVVGTGDLLEGALIVLRRGRKDYHLVRAG